MPDQPCSACRTPVPEGAAFCAHCGTQSPTVLSAAGPVTPPPPPAVEESVQDRLARALGVKYEVRRLLGQGGFAEVYEVWDRDLLRRLAVKVLKPDIAWSSGMLDRFKHEARAIARLNHTNILPIHFVGEGEGLVYYAMPFVDGQSLGAILRTGGALDPDRALAIARPILEALAHAHQNGLVHRDIKPDNVMIEAGSGRPLLVDFGIAKRLDGGAAHQTQTGFVVGTPQYMSPEQALGQGDIDARSDVYAMGAMLFQTVVGTPPFEGDTSQEIVGKHLTEPVPVATTRNAKIPMWLSDVIVRAMAKRPGERYQSAAMMLEALNTGRRSGREQAISAERVAARIQADDSTELLPSRERSAAPPRTAPATARRFPTGGLLLMLLAAGLTALVYVLFLARPTLMLENRLVDPIKVAVNSTEVQVAPRGTLHLPLPRGQRLVAHWYLVRPISRNGDSLGSALQGTFVEEHPRGKVRKTVDARSSGSAYFAPLITNASQQAIGLMVNAGLAGAVDCYCPQLPGVTREHIGYYPLFLNSAVEAYTTAGRKATFRDLGPKVDRTSGMVGLRFEDKDLK